MREIVPPVQTGYIEFRPRARLLKLIGSELISDDVLAITELVKNAHDADASCASIEFRGVTTPDGTISVRDDGHGMDLEVLLRHWMEPAGTSKSVKAGRLTKGGRRVLGEKGVGRFAADKLARHLELISRRLGERMELRARFDWDQFDTDARMLSDVKNRWDMVPPREIERSGTILRMTGLRTTWNERMFRRLSMRLARLRSPFAAADSFAIHIDSDEFPQYSGELKSDILERAPYRIDAIFDGGKTIQITTGGSRAFEHSWNGNDELSCGPVRVRLFAFDLETEAVARIGPRVEVRAWLKEWSGISVYRDGFRVWPYGEPHDDWLRLDQRRVNNPVTKLSNNQIVGFVEITRDGNPQLADQTNREGILQSRAFDDLRRLMHFVLQQLESQRQSVRHPSASARAQSMPPQRDEEELATDTYRLAESAPPELASELRRTAERFRETATRAESQHRLLMEGYSELAAIGQTAIGLARTVRPLLENIRNQVETVRTATDRQTGRAVMAALEQIEASTALLETRTAILTGMEQSAYQRRRTIDVPAEIEDFRSLLEPALAQTGTRILPELPGSGVLRVDMRPETFQCILHILVTNSLEWLRDVDEPEIRIRAAEKQDICDILFSDNGPGIPEELAEEVFRPMFSTREGARGMGLTLARNMVTMHGGTIEVVVDRRRRGATIRVSLPRKRSRATVHR